MQKRLVIIPAYNEEKSLPEVISSVRKEIPDADILVVNDGSSDPTGHVARRAGATVIDLPYNLGIGTAMQTGYQYGRKMGYDIAIQVDGDGQHPASQIHHLLKPLIDKNVDVVIGSRFLEKSNYAPSFSRSIGIGTFARLLSIILRQKITDPTSGFRAVNKEVIEFYSRYYPDDYPEVEALVLLYKAGFVIREVPVEMDQRISGISSITPFRSVYYMVKVTLAVLIDLLKRIERRSCYE